MKLLFVLLLIVQAVISALAQESINAHEGFDVGMQAGIALAICFSILGTFAITVNIIKRKCVKSIP
jgi:predicted histidine transporter YuiF (NhaC family)